MFWIGLDQNDYQQYPQAIDHGIHIITFAVVGKKMLPQLNKHPKNKGNQSDTPHGVLDYNFFRKSRDKIIQIILLNSTH